MVKAYMKTIEILLVIVLSTMFLLIIIPKPNTPEAEQRNYLIRLEKDNEFRSFATLNTGCYNTTTVNVATRLINGYLPAEYDFLICIDELGTVPDKERVYVDSLVIAGSYTSIDIKTIKLYYWLEQNI